MAIRQPMNAAGNLGSVKMREGGATGSQTWVRGAVLVAASGLLSEGGTNPTGIVGIAGHKVTSATSGATVHYTPVSAEQEFIASIDDSNDLGNGAIALTDRYTRYGITEDSDGFWYVDKNKSSDALVRVVVTELVDAVGEVQGRVKIRFLQNSDLGGTPNTVTIYAGSV